MERMFLHGLLGRMKTQAPPNMVYMMYSLITIFWWKNMAMFTMVVGRILSAWLSCWSVLYWAKIRTSISCTLTEWVWGVGVGCKNSSFSRSAGWCLGLRQGSSWINHLARMQGCTDAPVFKSEDQEQELQCLRLGGYLSNCTAEVMHYISAYCSFK